MRGQMVSYTLSVGVIHTEKTDWDSTDFQRIHDCNVKRFVLLTLIRIRCHRQLPNTGATESHGASCEAASQSSCYSSSLMSFTSPRNENQPVQTNVLNIFYLHLLSFMDVQMRLWISGNWGWIPVYSRLRTAGGTMISRHLDVSLHFLHTHPHTCISNERRASAEFLKGFSNELVKTYPNKYYFKKSEILQVL